MLVTSPANIADSNVFLKISAGHVLPTLIIPCCLKYFLTSVMFVFFNSFWALIIFFRVCLSFSKIATCLNLSDFPSVNFRLIVFFENPGYLLTFYLSNFVFGIYHYILYLSQFHFFFLSFLPSSNSTSWSALE